MSMAVVAGYTLAWLPFNLMVLVGFDSITWYPQYVFFACHSLAMAHTTYNPVIYAWMNVRFRTAFLSVLSRLNLLCPCLLNLCLARNNVSPNNTNQYLNSHNSHHSIYVRQQVYGSTNLTRNSNNLRQQQSNHKLPNTRNSQNQHFGNSRAACQIVNGSIKSTLESDPLVLITIPTHQIEQQQEQIRNNKISLNSLNNDNASTNNAPNNTNIIKKEEKVLEEKNYQQQIEASPEKLKANLESNHVPTQNGTPPTNTPTPSTPRSHLATTAATNAQVTTNKLSAATGAPSPVEIMATAKDEDLIENEDDDDEAETPVWT